MKNSELERLAKIIANRGYCSRRKAEELISSGHVKVDGKVETELGKKYPNNCSIDIDGQTVRVLPKDKLVYLALNKPVGFVCSASDPEGRRVVTELIPKKYGRVSPVGRLDINSQGLLFLSNDGEFINLITHPSSSPNKTYEVLVDSRLSSDELKELQEGILLEDGMTSPCKVKEVYFTDHSACYDVTIHEGKNREVRRMMQYFNKKVLSLTRIKIDIVSLGKLQKGSFVELPSTIVAKIKEGCLERKKNNTFVPARKYGE